MIVYAFRTCQRMPKQLAIPAFSQHVSDFGRFGVACPRSWQKLSSKYHIRIGDLVECQFGYTHQVQHEAVKGLSRDEKKKRKHTAVAARHTATLGTSQEKISGKAEPTDKGA